MSQHHQQQQFECPPSSNNNNSGKSVSGAVAATSGTSHLLAPHYSHIQNLVSATSSDDDLSQASSSTNSMQALLSGGGGAGAEEEHVVPPSSQSHHRLVNTSKSSTSHHCSINDSSNDDSPVVVIEIPNTSTTTTSSSTNTTIAPNPNNSNNTTTDHNKLVGLTAQPITSLALSREEFAKSTSQSYHVHPHTATGNDDAAITTPPITSIPPRPAISTTTTITSASNQHKPRYAPTTELTTIEDDDDDDWSISLDMSRVYSSMTHHHQQAHQPPVQQGDSEDVFGVMVASPTSTNKKQASCTSPNKSSSNNSSRFSIKSPMESFRKFVSPRFSMRKSESSVPRKSEASYAEIYMEQFYNWRAEQHSGVIVSWRDVTFKVRREKSWMNEMISKGLRKQREETTPQAQKKGDYITILNGIDGIAYPGSILAVMGSSGAGKSSLLNILAGQVKPTSGQVIINGLVVKQRLKSLVGYVYQDDMLMGNLTVRETLRYAALLRLPASTSYAEKMAKVDQILQLLKLDVCADTLVGEPGLTKGISGGERKRLGIAIALLTNPPILILDEPTTSLDAKTALDVVDTISHVAKRHNITVIMTIHQPRSDIFEKLENLLLLTNGRVAYFGSTSKVCKYFKKIGFTMNENYNPADFVMDLITEDTQAIFAQEKTLQSEQERISKIVQKFEEKKNNIIPSLHDTFELKECSLPKVERSSWMTQFFVMLVRGFLNQWRDFKYTKIRILQQIIYAILVGFIYFQTKNDQNSVQNKLGLLFFVVTNQWSNSFGTPISIFRGERLYFMRERGAKCFSISSYYFGRLLADLVLIVPHPVFFGTIVYLLAGLTLTIERYLVFIFIVLILSQTAHAFGTVLAILVPRSDVATMLLPPISTTFHVFSGFYRNIEQIPVWLSWFTYFSPFNYGFKALIINEFQGRTIDCPSNPNEICRFPNIDFILEYYGMNNDLLSMWINIAIVLGISVGMRIIAYLSLKFLVKSRKGA
ncbi:hypothetical protein C9374_004159 [Naegleria lovaniensis]|uniref:ABC transporter domain-containing protein n=1 Tax=Naegleria lovaniensis TaxID=51637 RepID=A0AA88GSS0_NAELO|nr:uncharacterized protein C9374_004159 [Naegleria lovaniensis]KAG2383488.1 hypothetical protein C9374_004159 [Naegleria lovaniensis]